MIMNKELQRAAMMGLMPGLGSGLFGLLGMGIGAMGAPPVTGSTLGYGAGMLPVPGLGAGAAGIGALVSELGKQNDGRKLLKRPVPLPSGPMPPWAPGTPLNELTPIPTPAVPSMPNIPIPWGLPMPPHQIQPIPTPRAIPDMPGILPPWGNPMPNPSPLPGIPWGNLNRSPGSRGGSALMDYINAISKDTKY